MHRNPILLIALRTAKWQLPTCESNEMFPPIAMRMNHKTSFSQNSYGLWLNLVASVPLSIYNDRVPQSVANLIGNLG